MNPVHTIASLNNFFKGERCLINIDNDGFITPFWMLDKGMWACYSCGYVNCVESRNCKGCNDEKFVLTDQNKNLKVDEISLFISHQIPKPKYRRKPVVDTVTGHEYGSVSIAAEALEIPRFKLCWMLRGDIPNLTNLQYKL